MLKVSKVVTGYLNENCYIIHDEISGLIIDPGSDPEKIIFEINKLKLKIKGILITHYHFDHVGALEYMKNMYPDAKIIDYKNKDDVIIDTFSFKVVETLGHTLDSCSYYFNRENIFFSGDFIFKDTIGNDDDDNEEDMLKSLKIIKYLPIGTIIYPGHGEITNVKNELANNPFLKGI